MQSSDLTRTLASLRPSIHTYRPSNAIPEHPSPRKTHADGYEPEPAISDCAHNMSGTRRHAPFALASRLVLRITATTGMTYNWIPSLAKPDTPYNHHSFEKTRHSTGMGRVAGQRAGNTQTFAEDRISRCAIGSKQAKYIRICLTSVHTRYPILRSICPDMHTRHDIHDFH